MIRTDNVFMSLSLNVQILLLFDITHMRIVA